MRGDSIDTIAGEGHYGGGVGSVAGESDITVYRTRRRRVSVRLKVTVSPGDKLSGSARPATENSAPVTSDVETKTTVLPKLVRVTLRVALEPTVTSPKSRLDGVKLNKPLEDTPFPASKINVGEMAASLVREMLPVTLPTRGGSKATLSVALSPTPRVKGIAIPVTLNSVPITLISPTVRDPFPELVRATVWVRLLPTGTSPKSSKTG